jgi:hypothetical protein
MLFFASRDPERNVAIIDAMIVGLVLLAVTPLISLETLDIRRLYPGYIILGAVARAAGGRGAALLPAAARVSRLTGKHDGGEPSEPVPRWMLGKGNVEILHL